MTTPRSHKEEETEAAAAAAAEPSAVAIGLSNLAGVPANLSSYLWGSKNEEAEAAAVEGEEAVAAVEEEEGTGVRYVRRGGEEGGGGYSVVGRIVARENERTLYVYLSLNSSIQLGGAHQHDGERRSSPAHHQHHQPHPQHQFCGQQ